MDTGPLVAYLNERDNHHDWAVERFKALGLPFITCEAVLAETCFLTSRAGLLVTRTLETMTRGVVQIGLQLQDELKPIRQLMERYANVPMSLADACMVRLAEITDLPLCTLDSDFTIYRAHGRQALNVITPGHQYLHEP